MFRKFSLILLKLYQLTEVSGETITESIDMVPPSKPSTGKLTWSSGDFTAARYSKGR
jgi:hypothetical protein